MKNNLDELDDLDESYDETVVLDLSEISKNIREYTSQKLCEMIICDRYFGCYKELAIICMEELANRRVNGDLYDFESYIDNSLSELPKLDFSVPDLGEVLRQSIRKIGK
jgi:hypothetical protein